MSPPPEVLDAFDMLCPMYVILDAEGRIARVGPTMRKLRPDTTMEGMAFLDLLELRRPRSVSTMPELMARGPAKLQLVLRDEPHTALKGSLLPLGDGKGAIVNLSFGISVVDAVRDYNLTSADFAATDLAIELLYLVEAKSAAMEASRKLNLRLQGAMMAAEEQAYTDTLTGLRNRRAMGYVLGRLAAAGKRFSLMQLDLDHFKKVNDTLGHGAGDFVLQRVAKIMTEEIRDSDTIARVGGDEFVLIFERLVDHTKLDRIARKLIGRICEPIRFQGQICRISVSIGTAMSPQDGPADVQKMLRQADRALYAAKQSGRAAHRFYTDEIGETFGGGKGGAQTGGAKGKDAAERRQA